MLDNKIKEANDIFLKALEKYKPKAVFCLYSGGHDSGTVTHLIMSRFRDRVTKVLHINTGTGLKETLEYVRNTSQFFGWPLSEYNAVDNCYANGKPNPQIFRDICLKNGFPGPGAHYFTYARLKERQLERALRDYKCSTKEPALLVTGVRREESSRRMGNVSEVQVKGRTVWVAPTINFTGEDCNDYFRLFKIPRSEVKDNIHMSGECLCGAFARKGELAQLEFFYPEKAAEIKALEKEVKAAGFPWGWEGKPTKEQMREIWAKRHVNKKIKAANAMTELNQQMQMLCAGCGKRSDDLEP